MNERDSGARNGYQGRAGGAVRQLGSGFERDTKASSLPVGGGPGRGQEARQQVAERFGGMVDDFREKVGT